MKANIVDLKFWRPEWVNQVYDWYESGDYSSFFRSVPDPAYKEQFHNFPQLIGNHVLGVFLGQDLIGLATFYDMDTRAKSVYAGAMISREHQVKGFATDVAFTLARYLFNNLNMRRIGMEFSGDDHKIVRIVNKFTRLISPNYDLDAPIENSPFFEGRVQKIIYLDGKYHDKILVRLFKNEYDKIVGLAHG